MNILEKYALGGVMLLVIFFAGAHFGDKRATEKYLPKIQQLKDEIDHADQEAKAKQKEYKENYDDLKHQNDSRINGIRDYYRGLLQSVSTKDSSGSASTSSKAVNGTTSKSTITGCPANIEQGCALDANQVLMFQEWVKKNKIPIN